MVKRLLAALVVAWAVFWDLLLETAEGEIPGSEKSR